MKKWLTFLILTLSVLIVGCQSNASTAKETTKKETTAKKVQTESFVYKKYNLDLGQKVVLGDKNAKNSIVLAFDYSCPWCQKWMNEVLPQIEGKYINNGTATYVGQPIVLLNQKSLYMAKVDTVMEKKYPDRYYELQRQFDKDMGQTDWGTEAYVLSVAKQKGLILTADDLNKADIPDPITVTRNFTKNLGVQGVPTLYVNGIKINDAFNVKEVDGVINGKIKENDVIQVVKNQ